LLKWLTRSRSDPDRLGEDMRTACATFVKRALRTGAADVMHLEMFGCSINGEHYGDWEFTCRRTKLPTERAGVDSRG
jgi:hypothetical protein